MSERLLFDCGSPESFRCASIWTEEVIVSSCDALAVNTQAHYNWRRRSQPKNLKEYNAGRILLH